MSVTTSKDPLGPLSFTARVMLWFLVGFSVLVLSTKFFGGHPVFGVWGDPDPCVLVSQNGLMMTGDSSGVANLHHGVRVGVPEHFRLCQPGMSETTKALFGMPRVVEILWVVGFLVFVIYLRRMARKHGLFTSSVAKSATQMGWYLVAGSLVCTLVHAVCFAAGISHLVTGYSVASGIMGNVSVSWAAIIGGVAAISVGRVMRQTIPMREEIEATV